MIGPHLGVIRYIGRPGHGKNFTRDELTWRIEHRQPFTLVYEKNAGWMLGGYDAGRQAAWDILGDWETNLGMAVRDLALVYAAADRDMTPNDLGPIDQCLAGMASVLHGSRVGVYGESMVVTHCVGQSHSARLGWQTIAWSQHQVSGFASLLQTGQQTTVGGIAVDVNTILKTDWGQIALPPYPTGDDMANSPAELTSAAYAAFKSGVTERWDPDKGPDTPTPYTIRELLVQFPKVGGQITAMQADIAALRAAIEKLTNPPDTE
jgi:hypothetical protein